MLLMEPVHSRLLEALLGGCPGSLSFHPIRFYFSFTFGVGVQTPGTRLKSTKGHTVRDQPCLAAVLCKFPLKVALATSSLCVLPRFFVHVKPYIACFFEACNAPLGFIPPIGLPRLCREQLYSF